MTAAVTHIRVCSLPNGTTCTCWSIYTSDTEFPNFFNQLLIRIHYPTGFGLIITRTSVLLQTSLTPVQCSL